MAFRVEISAQAERDAAAILEWLLSQHTGQAGIDWFLSLDNAFASLAEFPERCPIAPENARFNFEVPSAPLRTETSSLSHTVHHRSRHRTCPASFVSFRLIPIRWKASEEASNRRHGVASEVGFLKLTRRGGRQNVESIVNWTHFSS